MLSLVKSILPSTTISTHWFMHLFYVGDVDNDVAMGPLLQKLSQQLLQFFLLNFHVFPLLSPLNHLFSLLSHSSIFRRFNSSHLLWCHRLGDKGIVLQPSTYLVYGISREYDPWMNCDDTEYMEFVICSSNLSWV